jgi:hypothetical protein
MREALRCIGRLIVAAAVGWLVGCSANAHAEATEKERRLIVPIKIEVNRMSWRMVSILQRTPGNEIFVAGWVIDADTVLLPYLPNTRDTRFSRGGEEGKVARDDFLLKLSLLHMHIESEAPVEKVGVADWEPREPLFGLYNEGSEGIAKLVFPVPSVDARFMCIPTGVRLGPGAGLWNPLTYQFVSIIVGTGFTREGVPCFIAPYPEKLQEFLEWDPLPLRPKK